MDQFPKNQVLLQKIVRPLLEWYDQNARVLPWRENTDPYRVWVSEIMLQQTRVEAVKPYFERFMRQLPDLQSLAAAEEETLLKLWEGLGYYSRVKNLQKAAQIICNRFGGFFPGEYADILSLPGIGPYTAGAISSISFHRPVPAVDGNVLRVIARLTEDGKSIADAQMKSQVTETLRRIYPESRSGDFTQSLMELGATVCIPAGMPKCIDCPLSFACGAYRNHTQAVYPVKPKKQARRQEDKTVLLLCFEDKIAVRKRDSGGLLGGLWEFPNLEGKLSPEEVSDKLCECGIVAGNIQEATGKKHIFTHVEWRMSSYLIECVSPDGMFVWVTRQELEREFALPTAFKKFLSCWPDRKEIKE